MILGKPFKEVEKIDLSRVCGDDPEVSDYEGDGGEFVPRMRG